MNKLSSVGVKITILVVVALLFGATMVALSLRDKSIDHNETFWHGGNRTIGGNKTIDKTFSVQQDGKLIVDADEGNITISGTDDSEVSVHILARGSDERLQKFDVKLDQDGDVVRILNRQSHTHFHFFENNDLNVDFEIKIPHTFNLDLRTAGGNISIRQVKGKIVGETSGGDIDLSSLEGDLKMNTSGGNVNLTKSSGDFDLETSGGNMFAETITGSIHMETSGGNIDVRDSDGKLVASTSGGDIKVSMKDNKGIDLSTSGGSVTVKLPSTAHGDVNAETSGGDVSTNLPFSGKIKDGKMKGKINGGGELIKLETSGGDIVINSGEKSADD